MVLCLCSVSCLSSGHQVLNNPKTYWKWKSSSKLRRKWEFNLMTIVLLGLGLYVDVYTGSLNIGRQVYVLYEEYLSKIYLGLTSVQSKCKWFNCYRFIIDRYLKQIKFYHHHLVKFKISMLRIKFRRFVVFQYVFNFLKQAMESLYSRK